MIRVLADYPHCSGRAPSERCSTFRLGVVRWPRLAGYESDAGRAVACSVTAVHLRRRNLGRWFTQTRLEDSSAAPERSNVAEFSLCRLAQLVQILFT